MAAVEMDQELARRLFFEGGTLVILGVPKGTEFGIDYNTWEVGPKFKGVKMIPPGIHFMHYSAASSTNARETGPRTGFFFDIKQREVLVKRWDKKEEEIVFVTVSQAEVERIRENLTELDQCLGPYPYETMKKWVSLTNHITAPLIQKLQPESGKICAFAEVQPEVLMPHTKDRVEQNLLPYDTLCKSYEEGMARLPKMKIKPGTEIRFSNIPKQKYPDGATPAEITKYNMDFSFTLESVINQRYSASPKDILGELQFSFVCFLIGNVYDAFEHWKDLLQLLCHSEEAVGKRTDLYTLLISALYHQLSEIPADFFVDIVSKDNFLTTTLQEFFSYMHSPMVDEALQRRVGKFKAHLTRKFKWDFDEEPDDCAPVMVDLPEGVVSSD
ncbi:protein AAR2 homolog [Callorhinchus milii]|uniref:protein AAR2 homolog n=1 Tax=Callorhinchus milii TaxID=7868 RepID=UPI001C3F7EC0|nr:protein AAR2 homolog [Callorhinchus milii]